MAGKEQAEEKALPASQKKLRDSRRKGQVSHSKDFISGFTFVVVLVYLLFSWTTIRDHILELMQVVASSSDRPFAATALHANELAISALLAIITPVVACVVVVGVVAGMVGTLGPIFAFDLVTPKMDHINPAEGLKRLFSLRSIIEFGKNLFKLVVLGVALFLVMRIWLQNLFEIPACGSHCIAPVMLAMLKALGAIAAIAFIAVGFIDLLLQRALFLRDMRMTRTEHKREQKDIEGDPIIRAEQRRRRRSFQFAPTTKLGVSSAVCLIFAPGRYAVGMRYNPKDTPVPAVVSKAQGLAASSMAEQAKHHKIPIIEDSELAQKLFDDHAMGDMIRREHFTDIANLLVRLGLV